MSVAVRSFMSTAMIDNKEPQRYVSFRRSELPQLPSWTPQAEPRLPLVTSGPPDAPWRMALQLRVLAWLVILGLTVQFLGWMSKRDPESLFNFSLREHKRH